MKSPALMFLVPALALASCRDGSNLDKQQQQYEVVQEGVANGANPSSLTAGQVAPPLTGTAVDTTTAFQLPVAAPNTSTAPGTIADTLTTAPAYGSVPPAYQPAPPPATAGRAASAPRPASPAPRPAPTEQAEAPAPVPTLTGGFTSAANSRPTETQTTPSPAEPAEEEEVEEEEEESEPAPPPSDPLAPPPPGTMAVTDPEG